MALYSNHNSGKETQHSIQYSHHIIPGAPHLYSAIPWTFSNMKFPNAHQLHLGKCRFWWENKQITIEPNFHNIIQRKCECLGISTTTVVWMLGVNWDYQQVHIISTTVLLSEKVRSEQWNYYYPFVFVSNTPVSSPLVFLYQLKIHIKAAGKAHSLITLDL